MNYWIFVVTDNGGGKMKGAPIDAFAIYKKRMKDGFWGLSRTSDSPKVQSYKNELRAGDAVLFYVGKPHSSFFSKAILSTAIRKNTPEQIKQISNGDSRFASEYGVYFPPPPSFSRSLKNKDIPENIRPYLRGIGAIVKIEKSLYDFILNQVSEYPQEEAATDSRKEKFRVWMRSAQKEDGTLYSPNSIPQYIGYIERMPDFVFKSLGIKINDLFQISTFSKADIFFGEYLQNIEPALSRTYPAYPNANKITNFNSAFRLYMRFLAESESREEGGVDAFIQRNDVPQTEKEALIKARVGQSEFRRQLIKLWGRCSVTGYDCDHGLLIASHIRPWSKASPEQRKDSNNGLLLTPNLDKVFDRGFITFNQDGTMRISSRLNEPERFGIRRDMRLVKLRTEIEPYMSYHRGEVFK